MKTPTTFQEWWNAHGIIMFSNLEKPAAERSWNAALANSPQPQWLKREKDSECQPPFAVLSIKENISGTSHGTYLVHIDKIYDYYFPLPPIPKQKDEAEDAVSQYAKEHPNEIVSVDDINRCKHFFNLGRAKGKGEK